MDKEQKNLRVFGYGWALILTVAGLRLWMKDGAGVSTLVLWTAALGFLFVTVWRIGLLKPVYKIWMAAGHKVSFVGSTIVLGVLFYTVFSVAGLLLRLLRKDLLNRSWERQAGSYWLAKEVSRDIKESQGKLKDETLNKGIFLRTIKT